MLDPADAKVKLVDERAPDEKSAEPATPEPQADKAALLEAAKAGPTVTVDTSLYQALEANGNRPVRALQRLRALLLNTEQARLLNAQEGDAGLLVERLGYLPDGRAIELSQSYYRADMYEFIAELNA